MSASNLRRSIAASEARSRSSSRHRVSSSREDEDVSHAIADFLRTKASTSASTARLSRIEKQDDDIAVTVETSGARGPRSPARICCWRSAGARTPMISGSTRPASPPTNAVTSRSTSNCARACPASGRWATATAAAPSPIHPGTISRSSRQICSTTSPRRVTDRIAAYALYTDPPLGRAGHDRGGGAQIRHGPRWSRPWPWRT